MREYTPEYKPPHPSSIRARPQIKGNTSHFVSVSASFFIFIHYKNISLLFLTQLHDNVQTCFLPVSLCVHKHLNSPEEQSVTSVFLSLSFLQETEIAPDCNHVSLSPKTCETATLNKKDRVKKWESFCAGSWDHGLWAILHIAPELMTFPAAFLTC